MILEVVVLVTTLIVCVIAGVGIGTMAGGVLARLRQRWPEPKPQPIA